MGWAGSQSYAQEFALRFRRRPDVVPSEDRLVLKAAALATARDMRADFDPNDGTYRTEIMLVWMERDHAVGLWLLNSGQFEWIPEARVMGMDGALRVANHGLNTLRFVGFSERSVEQVKIIGLKVMRDAIDAVEGLGGDIQIGSVDADGVTVEGGKRALRGLSETLDVWEERCAELLPGAEDIPSRSDTPDVGLGPPASTA